MVVFEVCVIIVAVFGAAANDLMLFAFVQSKTRIVGVNIVQNRMILDLVCCIKLVVIFARKISNVDYTGKTVGNKSTTRVCIPCLFHWTFRLDDAREVHEDRTFGLLWKAL